MFNYSATDIFQYSTAKSRRHNNVYPDELVWIELVRLDNLVYTLKLMCIERVYHVQTSVYHKFTTAYNLKNCPFAFALEGNLKLRDLAEVLYKEGGRYYSIENKLVHQPKSNTNPFKDYTQTANPEETNTNIQGEKPLNQQQDFKHGDIVTRKEFNNGHWFYFIGYSCSKENQHLGIIQRENGGVLLSELEGLIKVKPKLMKASEIFKIFEEEEGKYDETFMMFSTEEYSFSLTALRFCGKEIPDDKLYLVDKRFLVY